MDLSESILPLEERTQAGFLAWIISTMNQWIDDPGITVDPTAPFAESSLDSVAAMQLLGMLEVLMEQPMDATLFAKYPTPAALAGHLGELAEIA